MVVQTKVDSFESRLDPAGKKKLLALDGGGILGVLSLEFLARIEDTLRRELGKGPGFVLADYFDYIAGTSTGAIIATCLALGMSVDQVSKFYRDQGRAMFEKGWFFERYYSRYRREKLEQMLKERIREATGEDESTLGTEKLRTLLMVVLRNATTDSPWPLSNNPGAMFNDPALPDCNLKLPLWQLVRASTAAPTYFPPEEVQVGPRRFIFVDGGVTVFNNPALQLFVMATVDAYRLNWHAGEDRMLVVSIGTGAAPNANANLKPGDLNLLYNATSIPSALMAAANAQQDMLCRIFGTCRHGAAIDMEVEGLMSGEPGHPLGQINLTIAGNGAPSPASRLFSYVRYNVDLTQDGLDELGLRHIRAQDVQQMDSVSHIEDLAEIGCAAAARDVSRDHFRGFLG
ncbi:MAG TPA: patatin-like phospholipase family protein [Isosphaeraceae bacterium]|jgi:predicted acylesterase/phospholipase RssA|nr:patatin-like phospholipase family protein [Isosphaeraceae bacterium]